MARNSLAGITVSLLSVLALPVLAAAAIALVAAPALAALPNPLPDPDGKPADMSKPVQVYILMGQSNMLGFGTIAGATKDGTLEYAVNSKNKYPYLVDNAGNWTVRQDVRYTRVMSSGTGSMSLYNNQWMTIGCGNTSALIGTELAIGNYLGYATDAPVLILKSCIGNRSLGWDLLPPGSERYEVEENGKTMVYAGYKDSPDKWEKGTTPVPISWYAGMQYDGDTRNAKTVLNNLGTYYPGATKYEVAGFFWWQGDKDRYNAAHAGRYEQNLVQLIEQLRKEFDAPNAKFVCATLGQTVLGDTSNMNEKFILDAQLAVSDAEKYPQFEGNVATVYSNPLSMGGASNSHYNNNAETYMNVGEAMGKAMVDLNMIPEPSSLTMAVVALVLGTLTLTCCRRRRHEERTATKSG